MSNQGATLHGVVCKIFTKEPDDYFERSFPSFSEPWATTSEMHGPNAIADAASAHAGDRDLADLQLIQGEAATVGCTVVWRGASNPP